MQSTARLRAGSYILGAGRVEVKHNRSGYRLVMGRATYPINTIVPRTAVTPPEWKITYMVKGRACQGVLTPTHRTTQLLSE